MRLAWVVFALRRQPALESLALLSQGIAINERERKYVTQLLACGTPLRDVVGEALRLRLRGAGDRVARLHVECLRLGSTVRLARGTQLYAEPFRDGPACVVATLSDQEQLDVVAHVLDKGGHVAVVFAGFGLVWTPVASVVAWHRLDEADKDGNVVMHQNDTASDSCAGFALTSLSLAFDGFPFGVPPGLRRTASCVAPLLSLLAFPALQSLVLDRCVVESVTPLLDAYSHETTRIAALSLLRAYDLRMRDKLVYSSAPLGSPGIPDTTLDPGDASAWLGPLVDSLASGITNGILEELHLDVIAMASQEDARAVLLRLTEAVGTTGSLPLGRLHFTCDLTLLPTCDRAFSALRDTHETLKMRPSARRAVLSVLRSGGCAIPEIAQTVFALAQRRYARVVTWDGRR